MDYKFVEQLLEKYFAAETSLEEERVLRDCMTLPGLPQHLARYADLFLYEDAQAVEGKVVKYFYWVDVPEDYKTEDFAWAKYEFKCAGENVEVTVNGNPMEVVHVDGVDYYAKLTEFGAVAIMCD